MKPRSYVITWSYQYLGSSGAFYESRSIPGTLLSKTSVYMQNKNKHLCSSSSIPNQCNATTGTLLGEFCLEEILKYYQSDFLCSHLIIWQPFIQNVLCSYLKKSHSHHMFFTCLERLQFHLLLLPKSFLPRRSVPKNLPWFKCWKNNCFFLSYHKIWENPVFIKFSLLAKVFQEIWWE